MTGPRSHGIVHDDPWRLEAACRGMGAELFHPHETDDVSRSLALSICRECEVRPECLEANIGEDHGIWGATTPDERRRLRRRRRRRRVE